MSLVINSIQFFMLNYKDALFSSLSTAVGQIKPVIVTNNDQKVMEWGNGFALIVGWFCF